MDAGKLRHRIHIDERVTSQDEHGEPIVTWTPWATNEPAQIADISGREFFAGQGIAAEVTTRITIRWRSGLVPTMRIRHVVEDGSPPVVDYYDIKRMLRDQESGRDFVTMMCTRGVNEG